MKLLDIFKNSKNKVVFYHEDFYRQVELAHSSYFMKIEDKINKLPKQEASQLGSTNIGIRDEASYLSSENISLSNIKTLLNPISINFFKNVESGYGKSENVVVWGFERFGLFVEYNSEEIITSIWMTHSEYFPEGKTGQKLFNALTLLGQKYSLYIVDWDIESSINLSDKQSLKDYFQETYWLYPSL